MQHGATMTFIDSSLSDIAQSGDHRRGDDAAPAKYKDRVASEFGDRIIETMSRLDWAFVGTLAEDGWPLTSASRFVLTPDAESRPITYVTIPRGSLAEAHIEANPRVGFEAHLAVGWLERRKARAVQIQALASFVEAPETIATVRALFDKKYADDTAYRFSDGDRIVKLTPLSIVNFYAAGRPQWGYIDYTAAA